jgi:hypothetical protein
MSKGEAVLLADFSFFDVLWLGLIFSLWLAVLSFVVVVLVDNFRRHDHSGWAKAGWTLFVLAFPLFGALVYQIARPKPSPMDEDWDASRAAEARAEAAQTRMGVRTGRGLGESSPW